MISKLSNKLWTAILVILGLLLVILSADEVTKFDFLHFDVSTACSTLGTFLVISAIVSFYFENQSKRRMFEEVFEKVVGSTSVFHSGITECISNSRDINYAEDFRRTRNFTAFFSYSTENIKKYRAEIEHIASSGGQVTLIFLNPQSPTIACMKELGWHESSIQAAYEIIEDWEKRYAENSNLEVKFINGIPRYSAMIFDHCVYVVENTVSTGRTNVPATKFSNNGFLYEFYTNDLKRAYENG
ncbi:hypothetical protein [Ruegeria meonggei]|uniref:hypothetical protein n=1 Tax=Ruegeria meonggei TaxID=1446476 RepID=UPI00366B9362